MAPGISEGILPTEHKSEIKPGNHHVMFSRKRGVETPKSSVFGNFWKIVELNPDVLEPLLLSEIDNWSLFFKMSQKLNWLHANNMTPGVSKGILHAEHKFEMKNFPSRQVFEKKGDWNP